MVTRDFLRSVPLFASLNDADADALASIGREEVFQKGQVVFRERDAGGRLFVVISGVVEISKAAVHGGPPVPLARVERGDVLGELGAFDGGPRSATATASLVPETRLATWDVEDFHAFLGARPQAAVEILHRLLRIVSSRLRRTSEAVQVLLRSL